MSVERSLSNAVKPTFCLRDFVGTRAFKQYQEWVSSSLHLPCLRRLLHPRSPCSPSQLLDLDCVVHGCFGALFQGDAAGVELATAAHASFLEEGGVLPDCEHGRLLARHAVAADGPWTGIVIDDFFSVSVEPVFGSPSGVSASERLVRRAKQCYDRAGVLGSDNKDVFGASVFTLAGAECDSSPASVKEGLVTVASPAQKRLALALVSLRAASSRVISQELASMLSGSWVSALMFRRPAMAIADKIFGLGSGVQTWESGSRLVPSRARGPAGAGFACSSQPALGYKRCGPLFRDRSCVRRFSCEGSFYEAACPQTVRLCSLAGRRQQGLFTPGLTTRCAPRWLL